MYRVSVLRECYPEYLIQEDYHLTHKVSDAVGLLMVNSEELDGESFN